VNENGILTFNDREQVKSVLAYLESNDHNSETYGDDLDIYVIPREFLDDFESQLGFSSLRKQLETVKHDYLSSGGIPNANSPYFNYPVSDEYWQSILNTYHEFGIGDTIFKFVDDYSVIMMWDLSGQDL